MVPSPRELVESTLIERIQSRTIQQLSNRGDILINKRYNRCKIRDDTLQDRRDGLLRCLEKETAEVIALKKCHAIQNAAGDVSWIDADEGVGRAGVSTELNDFGVFGGEDRDVGLRGFRLADGI